MVRLSLSTAALLLLASQQIAAFSVAPSPTFRVAHYSSNQAGAGAGAAATRHCQSNQKTTPLFATSSEEQSKRDDEIERLKSMAQKLRSEALQLEAERAKELAGAAERAFRKFDTNQDGEISLKELKEGLEKSFKTELPEKRVKKLMEDFDTSGDGVLKLDEFVGVDKFRNRLEALALEEKRAAVEAEKAAQAEKEMTKILEAQMELINDREPTGTEKIISVLPYLFPLLDGLQFGRFLIVQNADNPLVGIIAVIFALYKSIPFSGFIAFFALNFLSANPSINRLIRFNMQQAIFLDIFLFFPGLIAALYSLIAQGLGGGGVPAAVTELGSDAIFFSLLAAIGYATIFSLLGKTPDKIPFLSQIVSDRMPNFEVMDISEIQAMRNREEGDKKKEDEKKDKED